jgi:hypothetical protein
MKMGNGSEHLGKGDFVLFLLVACAASASFGYTHILEAKDFLDN